MSAPYITFAAVDGNETFYLPASTSAERYARELAPDIFTWKKRFDMAYLNVDPTVLIPLDDLAQDLVNDIDGSQIVGVPVRLVEGLAVPMIGFELRRTDMP